MPEDIKPKEKRGKLRLVVRASDENAPSGKELISQGYSVVKEKGDKTFWEKEAEPTKALTKIKLKAGESAKGPLGEGWQVVKSDKGTTVYERTKSEEKPSSKLTPSISKPPTRELTEEEMKLQLRGRPNPYEAQYREDSEITPSSEKQRFVVKQKQEKSIEKEPSYTGKERRESRRASKMMCTSDRKAMGACGIGRNRISRAKY